MNIEGMFDDDGWFGNKFHIWHPEKGFDFWTANGFTFFNDYDGAKVPFLKPMNYFERRKVWKELKRSGIRKAEKLAAENRGKND